jgi:hypothetical protein
VARVTRAFTEAGILVHAYLMYGFPTETTQETVDSLELVRQLFAAECLQSGFWHRFAATRHSPVGQRPDLFGIRLHPDHGVGRAATPTFARNEVGFDDPIGTDHDRLGVGLRKALYNYMLGLGLEEDVRTWFAESTGGHRGRSRRAHGRVPATTVPGQLIRNALAAKAR